MGIRHGHLKFESNESESLGKAVFINKEKKLKKLKIN